MTIEMAITQARECVTMHASPNGVYVVDFPSVLEAGAFQQAGPFSKNMASAFVAMKVAELALLSLGHSQTDVNMVLSVDIESDTVDEMVIRANRILRNRDSEHRSRHKVFVVHSVPLVNPAVDTDAYYFLRVLTGEQDALDLLAFLDAVDEHHDYAMIEVAVHEH